MSAGVQPLYHQRTVLWLPLLLISLLIAVIASGCIVVDLNSYSKETVTGSGEIVTDERRVAEFKTIKLKGIGRVVLTQGQNHSVAIKTEHH